MEPTASLTDEILYQAVKARDLVFINRFLEQNKNWIAIDHNGDTVLHLAFSNKERIFDEQPKIIQILESFLNEGLSINMKNRSGKTILYSAVENRLKDVINFLVNRKANFNVSDQNSNSVVHFLIEDQFKKYSDCCNSGKTLANLQTLEHEDIEFMIFLLTKDINLDRRNDDRKTALDLAISRNLQHVMPILIRCMKDVTYLDEDGRTLIEIFFRKKERMNIMSISIIDQRPITTHVHNKYYGFRYKIDVVKSLLNKEVSVDKTDKKGNTLVHRILKTYDLDPKINYLILKRYTKINRQNQDGNTVLHLAIMHSITAFDEHKKNTIKFVRMLLSKGADVHLKNRYGDTPVRLAVRVKHMAVLNALIEYGADLRSTINGGNLLFEINKRLPSNVDQKEYAPMIDMLVSAGNDVNEVEDDGTPLIAACINGFAVIAQKFIENGANVNYQKADYCWSPLLVAANCFHNCQGDLFKVLLNAGADVHAKTDEGETVLHLASAYEYDVLKTLLEAGADVEVRCEDDRLPLHKVIRKLNLGGIRVMLEFGADVNDEGVLRAIEELIDNGITIRQYLDIVGTLAKHWIKLKAANLPVIDGFKVYASIYDHQQFVNECLREVETLKEHWFDGQFTLYNLLQMDVRLKSVLIANNEALSKLVKSPSLANSFPNYHTLILAIYNKAVARNPLLEPAKRAWYRLTDIDLPDICVECILAHMKNEELRMMAKEEKEISYLKRPSEILSNEVAKKFKLI